MLVAIGQDVFDQMDDKALIWACIEPTILQIRGKNLATKTEAASHLTDGQQALLMFQILYGHSGDGIQELFSSLSYLLSQKGFWQKLKRGIIYFNAHPLVDLIGKMEAVYPDGGDSVEFSRLNREFAGTLSQAVHLVAETVRNNSSQFVQFEG